MVGKKWLKLVKQLHQKKYRSEHGLFFVEGLKGLQELLQTKLELSKLFVTSEFLASFNKVEVDVISIRELKSISALKNPNGVLGVFKVPEPCEIHTNDWTVVLDDVRDPGNLGTIIRLCDWFGIDQVVCSPTTVDVYNPKVVQATMGSISRVNVVYTPLSKFLKITNVPIYGAYMKGNSVYTEALPKAGVLVMGNEANGISTDVEKYITNRISIPQFGKPTTESLNVAMATGILLNEIRRS